MTDLTYPAPDGPHPVGLCDGEFVDTAYPAVREKEARGRRCFVRTWYPAASGDGRRRRYFSDAEREAVTPSLAGDPPLPPTSWMRRLGDLETFSVVDAEPAAGAFPTLVFSHGASSHVGQNTALMEHLASHGYVVLSLGHPGEAAGIEYPDGSITQVAPDFTAALAGLADVPNAMGRATGDVATRLELTRLILDDKAMGPWSQRWVDDTRALLDALTSGSTDALLPEVLARCDLQRIGALGMSFGGGAAVSAAQADDRIKAAVNIDGGQNLSDLLDTDVRVPLLELTHDLFARLSALGVPVQALHYNEFFYEPLATTGTRADVVRLRLPDVAHMELMDLSFFPSAERAAALAGGGNVSSERLNEIMSTAVRLCFDHVLKGERNGYPDVLRSLFPELVPVDLAPLRDWAAQQA